MLQKNYGYLLLLGLLLVTTSLLMRLVKRRRQQRPMTGRLSTVETSERHRQQRGVRGDMEDLMVQIEQMAKRLGAQLDAKTIHLEKLLDEAEQRINEMRDLCEQASTSGSPASNAPPASPPSSSSASALSAPSAALCPPAADAASDDPLANTIYALADRGMDSVSIARQLDEHVGKVELILALRKT